MTGKISKWCEDYKATVVLSKVTLIYALRTDFNVKLSYFHNKMTNGKSGLENANKPVFFVEGASRGVSVI